MERDWCCTKCKKLLGVLRNGRLHIQFARGHAYLVGFPATSVCRACHTLNELPSVRDAEHLPVRTPAAPPRSSVAAR